MDKATSKAVKRKVFILAGQSNMAGFGNVRELPQELRVWPENVSLFTLKQGLRLKDDSPFGPELTFAHTPADQQPNENHLLIKYAVGSTSMATWSPEWDSDLTERTNEKHYGSLYRHLVGLTKTILNPESDEIEGVLWMQGERDAKFPDLADQYKECFRHLIGKLRIDLGTPGLPFVYGQINPPADQFTSTETVRKAQVDLSKTVERVQMVHTDDLAKLPDQLHYSTAGQIELGRRFGTAMLELLG